MVDARSERVPATVSAVLVALSVVTVVVAYPPPETGIAPLFGIGTMFLPLGLSTIALLVAAAGGILLGSAAANRTDSVPAPLIRILVPLTTLAFVGGYLLTVAGFGF